jgi:hypothetical protein
MNAWKNADNKEFRLSLSINEPETITTDKTSKPCRPPMKPEREPRPIINRV